jgi:hypothetical protein
MEDRAQLKIFAIAILVFLMVTSPALPHTVLLEAEGFDNQGGWVLDQQFMDQMGSPYLLAHGLGTPVADAVTTVTFPASGTYKMWVRTKDWVPGEWEPPGRFQVLINGNEVSTNFGTIAGWTWQDGGTVTISNTQVEIKLHDLTGFEGRCDAIYFDTDQAVVPPNDLSAQRTWRNGLRGLPDTPPDGGEFDVIIVGGGISGCAAALAAESQGLQVALIQDRMALGGNASSEIRVHTEGIHGQGGYILELLDTEHYPNGSVDSILDQEKREAAMTAAEGITIIRPYRAYDVQTDGSRIVSLDASSTVTSEALRFYSDIFIDCTGDGWIGYWAGANYTYGRESKDQYDEGWDKYGELWSPAIPDNRIMGSSLLWYSTEMSYVSTFPEVPWAMDVAKDYSATAGEWYWEYSNNDKHAIDDAEEIRDHMFRAIYGSFYNAKQKTPNRYKKLDWMGYLNGKRESRRLVGDYIYTLSDMANGTMFDDAVTEEIRTVDVHYQQVLEGSPYDFLSVALYQNVPRYYVPFRCLYSVNIDNLMMAGRCFSCSHIGLGGPRVMNTCGQMGIATGYAAGLCKKYDTNPRGVYTNYIEQLKDLVAATVDWLDSIGPNAALTAEVVVSSNYDPVTYPAENINDGLFDTTDNSLRWLSSAESIPDYIEFTWPGPQYISASRIISGWYDAGSIVDSLTDFTLQYHDGLQWCDIPEAVITNNTRSEWAGKFSAVRADTIRVVVSKTPDDISRIWEIEFYHPIADINKDGRVDIEDFAVISLSWLLQGEDLPADLVPDQNVNTDDLKLLNKFWSWP